MSARFLPGQVVSYPYLWAWQHERGETEGRKSRPTCVVVAVRGARDGLTHLALLAITTQPPTADRVGLEVSAIECRRAGLTDLKRCWVVVDEYNYDIAERSRYIEAGGKLLNSRAVVVQASLTSPRQVEELLIASSRAPIWYRSGERANPCPQSPSSHLQRALWLMHKGYKSFSRSSCLDRRGFFDVKMGNLFVVTQSLRSVRSESGALRDIGELKAGVDGGMDYSFRIDIPEFHLVTQPGGQPGQPGRRSARNCVLHACHLTMLETIGGREEVQRRTSFHRSFESLPVDHDRAHDKSTRDGSRFFDHPKKRYVGQTRFGLGVASANVRVIAGKPPLFEDLMAINCGGRSHGRSPADSPEILARFVDRICRSRKVDEPAEKAVEVVPLPLRDMAVHVTRVGEILDGFAHGPALLVVEHCHAYSCPGDYNRPEGSPERNPETGDCRNNQCGNERHHCAETEHTGVKADLDYGAPHSLCAQCRHRIERTDEMRRCI